MKLVPGMESCSLTLTLVIPATQENWKMRAHSGQDSTGGNTISLQESPMDAVSPYLITDLLNLPDGWREADDMAIFKKKKVSSANHRAVNLTLGLGNIQDRMISLPFPASRDCLFLGLRSLPSTSK